MIGTVLRRWQIFGDTEEEHFTSRLRYRMPGGALCTLGTALDGQAPRLNPVFVTLTDDLKVVFVSSAHSQHVAEIRSTGKASLCAASAGDDAYSVMFTGAARIAGMWEATKLMSLHALNTAATIVKSGMASEMRSNLLDKVLCVVEPDEITLFDLGWPARKATMHLR